MKKDRNTKILALASVTGALYAVLTVALSPISYGPLQFRISEALCVLPFLAPQTAYGLFVGCLIANIYTGNVFDIVFGSLATLIAGIITSKMKKPWQACIPPIVSNALVVAAVLSFGYNGDGALFPVYALQLAASEAVVMFALGLPLIKVLEKRELLKRFED